MSLAGTSRSAFYQYFEDLHDLMEALLRGLKEDIFDVAAPWLQGEGDPIPLLEETWQDWCVSAIGRARFCGRCPMPLPWMNGWKKRGRIS